MNARPSRLPPSRLPSEHMLYTFGVSFFSWQVCSETSLRIRQSLHHSMLSMIAILSHLEKTFTVS
eukprot:5071743-Pyramimonas_sp.AAC.1